MELQPNRNISESVLHDRRSINLLKSILPDNCVDCSQLQEGGTLPNIDGYLEILDENGIAREKITVQVKHLTYPEKNGKVFYDIPESVYAYAKIHKGELVFFIACDYASRKFYWRNIDTAAIEEAIVTMPNYFADYDTTVTFISQEELDRDHAGIPHGGSVIRTGTTGAAGENTHVIEDSLKLDSNPEFTGSVLVACARACWRMACAGETGCRTIFDIAPALLSPMTPEELRAKML